MAAALQREASSRITNNAAEAAALRRHNAGTAAVADGTGHFVLVKIEYIDEGGCQISPLLAELPSLVMPLGDTALTRHECPVKWWGAEPQPRREQKGTYDGKWRKWKERASGTSRAMVQAELVVKRGRMRFTREAELAGGVQKLNASTLAKTRELPYARYGDFSSPASSCSSRP
jgi:hypothetical protein